MCYYVHSSDTVSEFFFWHLNLIHRLIIVNLAVGLMMLVGAQDTSFATSTSQSAPIVVSSTFTSNQSTEEVIREYFKDDPLLVDIARCESHFRQFNKDGSVHRGVVNNKDVGAMQINEHYHLETSKKKGYDIYTLEGNLKYARDLYDRQGPQPWISSSPCWGKAELAKK